MRSLLFLALIGCAAEPPAGPEVTSCEDSRLADISRPNLEFDVVLVVSDAPGMASYRDALIENLIRFGDVLTSYGGGTPSVRVTVVGVDGTLTAEPRIAGCAGPVSPFLDDRDLPWFWCIDAAPGDCRLRNYDGPLGEAMACIGAVEADGADAPPLLERLEQALASDGVIRPEAHLAVLLIGVDDDASPGDAAGYAERLRAGRADARKVVVGHVGGASTPRLDAFLAEFPERDYPASIDDASWYAAFSWEFRDTLEIGGCLDVPNLLDVDPDAPGLQTECVAVEYESGAVVPPCLMETADRPDPNTPMPCYWIHELAFGGPECMLQATIERQRGDGIGLIRCACVP